MILKYEISTDEYVECQRAFRLRLAKHRILFRNLYGTALVSAFLSLYAMLSGSRWLAIAFFLVACGLLLQRTILWRMRAVAVYRSNPKFHEQIELKIDENHLVLTSPVGSNEIRWASISACHETKNLFLLGLDPDGMLVIPKRAFLPGDLAGFKELRKKELIVPTTRENPDLILLRFVVGWAVTAIAVISLSIGYVHNFFFQLNRNNQPRFSSAAHHEKSVPASPAELRGRGTVYLVPIGTVKTVSIPSLSQDLQRRFNLQPHVLPPMTLPSWVQNVESKQFVAEDLVTAMKLAYPNQAADPNAVMIGLTDENIYISSLSWTYAFSFREEERFAVISSARLSEDEDDKPVAPDLLQKRMTKVLVRDLGVLYYRLQPSYSYDSILYNSVSDASELDDIGDDYLEADVLVRADLHVENGDPCFVLRQYVASERQYEQPGRVTGCDGWYREPNLETVQIDLRYGLLLDQRTDFLIKDRLNLDLTRVLRTQDSRSRAFGIGGNHTLNIFLVGDKWPFTWMDLVREHGGRAHFRRTNWGFGYWDAHYMNQDANGTKFSGSTIDWAWPGWKLNRNGLVYKFPDPRGGGRPEQGALVEIDGYNNNTHLTLNRDAAGNLLLARSPGGKELAFKYDSSNRITEADQKDGGHFEYSYDVAGHLKHVTDAEQRSTDYDYDQQGRMSRIVLNGKEICTLRYDADDRVKSEVLPGGRTYLFRYYQNSTGNVYQVDISDSAGPTRRVRLSTVDYTLDTLAGSAK